MILKKLFIGAISCLMAAPTAICADNRWKICDDGSITWKIKESAPAHKDHVEMSGQQISVVLRYGVDDDGAFKLNRALVFPMLRLKPNKTQSNLKQRFDIDIPGLITVDELNLTDEKVKSVNFDGIMTVESSFSHVQRRKKVEDAVSLKRTLYPSPNGAFYCEEYSFTNNLKNPLKFRIPQLDLKYVTPEEVGVYGSYTIEASMSKDGVFEVQPGETLDFNVVYSGRKSGEAPGRRPNMDAQRDGRRALIRGWWDNLVLDTPDSVLNTMFAFAKLRGAESIYNTKGGLMHGPGGEAYYAAVWANDQAEYINPFFPFLGYEIGNQSALNAFRHFARYMNDEYKPIPSSIISEGVGTWHGAKDRGDGAMIAYGASRYALARASKEEAKELWPLIEWCLEYCRRQLNEGGVVASDSDELENRFPSGDANLCTSTLYYDALLSAAYLGKELGIPAKQIEGYRKQATELRKSIESYFGRNVEGFDTYQYYDGNDVLRSWICMPLIVGIDERATGTIDALFSPRLWTDDGLLTQAGTETFWDRSTLYALRGTLAAGETERGMDFLKRYSGRRLLGDHVPYAIEAWPEGDQRHLSAESGLYCRIFTEGLFGIRPTGFSSFDLTPRLPKEWNYANLCNVRAFGDDFDIRVSRIKGNRLDVQIVRGDKVLVNKKVKEGETIRISLPKK